MIRRILVALVALCLFAPACAAATDDGLLLGIFGQSAVSASGPCAYVSSIDDGCAALNAAGHLGLITFNSLNGLGARNSFFTTARQSGQTYVGGAHPISFNQPGGDYGIGPWTPDASLTPAINAGVLDPGLVALGCVKAQQGNAYFYANCQSTQPNGAQYQGVAVTGASVSGGVLTIPTGGPNSTQANSGTYYVHWSRPEAGNPPTDLPYGPYQITGFIDATHFQLAGSPPDIAAQQLVYAKLWQLRGYIFNDVVLLLNAASGKPWTDMVIDVENNKFITGDTSCAFAPGFGSGSTFFTGSAGWIRSNAAVMDRDGSNNLKCSTRAGMYPAFGATRTTFTGSTVQESGSINASFAGTVMTVNSATVHVGIGTLIIDANVGTTVMVKTAGTGTGGAGTYNIVTCTLAIPTAAGNCVTNPTYTGGPEAATATTNVLTVSSGAAPAVFSYVAQAGMSAPASYQVLQDVSGGAGTAFSLSPEATVPTLSGTFTGGPIQSAAYNAFSLGSATSGYWNFQWNYLEEWSGLGSACGVPSVDSKYNFIQADPSQGSHGDPVTHFFIGCGGGWTASATYNVARWTAQANTVFADQYSGSGNLETWGGFSGWFTRSGNSGHITVIPSDSSISGTAYVNYGSIDVSDNILIANNSVNNTSGSGGSTTSYLIYVLAQGTNTFKPAVPSGSFKVNGNVFDATSANGSYSNAALMTTAPAGGTVSCPATTRPNIDLKTGLTVTLTQTGC